MQKSNNRFNKSRSTDKKPTFKSGSKSSGPKRSSGKERDFDKSERSYTSKNDRNDGRKSDFRSKDKGGKSFDKDKRGFGSKYGDKKFEKSDKDKRFDRGEKKNFRDRDENRKPFDRDKKDFDSKRSDKKFDKPYKEKRFSGDKKYSDKDRSDKPYYKKDRDHDSDFRERKKEYSDDHSEKKRYNKHDGKDFDRGYKKTYKKHHDKKHKSKEESHVSKHTDGSIRLNKYLSNAGVSSRREADELIKAGAVTVNGKVVTEMGYRVMTSDKINYGGETLRHEKKVYLILNKPKDYLTTTDDPRERRTVMELIQGACRERVYPVGRLDRNTTGLLLFTNDGELATKLMHPKHGIKKVYHVLLNKNMKPADYAQLHEGVELEDGFIKPDDASFVGEGKKEIGIEIHSGKNRIVRRIFEHLGYEVVKLDRVVFAGLTKKDLPRGKWRFLNEKEVGFLKMIG